eukprot:9776114-Alexandrium_andersonii.AAC.1
MVLHVHTRLARLRHVCICVHICPLGTNIGGCEVFPVGVKSMRGACVRASEQACVRITPL